MRMVPFLVCTLLVLAGCESAESRRQRFIPAPSLPSQSALLHCQNAQRSTYEIDSLDLCADERTLQLAGKPTQYLGDARRCDPIPSPFVATAWGDLLTQTLGPAHDDTLAAYELSIAGLEEWWVPGWLGLARCYAARGDAQSAERALGNAESAIVRFEQRLTEGADLPRKRSILEIVGVLPPPRDVVTGNADALELYFALFREQERWALPLPSIDVMSDRQVVTRLKSRAMLLRSALRGEGPANSGPSLATIDLVLLPQHDSNFTEARLLRAQALYAAGRLDDAWATIGPFVTQGSTTLDTDVTARDVRFVRLAANIARRWAAQHPDGSLHGHDPTRLAEELFTQVVRRHPGHTRALLEAADNLLTYIERSPDQRRNFVPYVAHYLEQAQAHPESCSDRDALASLTRRLGAL